MGAFLTPPPVSIGAAGLAPKLPNDATKYLDGSGAYSVPAGGGTASAGVVVQEVDGSPSGTATVLVLPNTTLAISGGTATYTPTGGGSSIVYPALKPGSLDGTYGDDFTTASLNARWTTAHGATLGDCFGGSVDGSFVEIPYVGATGSWLLQAAPAGDFTISAGDIRMASINTNTTMYGIGILDSSGDGVSCIVYSDGNAYLINTIAYVYSATLSGSSTMTGGGYTSKYPQQVSGFWAKITKSGTGYTGAVSWSGKSWDFTSTGGSKSFTPAYIGIGWIFPTSSQQGRLQAEWFNKS